MTKEGFLKHKKVIEAWANGAEVCLYDKDDDRWYVIKHKELVWGEDMVYAIKDKLESSKKSYIQGSNDCFTALKAAGKLKGE